ncbi:MAG: hypothetical protein KJ622_02010, partial [Alphaproteobacteria bacterium]|nr:hypothetical protein [Alphaproteobacteria bacterium]
MAIIISNDVVSESSLLGTVVGILSSDVLGAAITWQILNDPTGGGFAIDGDRLVVLDGSLIDFETLAAINLQIEGTDASTATDTSTLSILVTDLNEILGTALDDVITGTLGADLIQAGDGNDTVDGSFGDDVIEGGIGNDFINDHQGSNSVDGGDGDDFISVAGGANIVDGGLGSDFIENFGEASILRGGDGDDVISSFGSTLTYASGYPNYTYTYVGDVVDAGAGNDIVNAGINTTVTLGAGNDLVRVGDGLVVTDFSITDDKIGIEALLQRLTDYFGRAPWDQQSNPFGEFLQIVQNGADAELQILHETEGFDPVTFDPVFTYEFRTVTTLQNVDASLLTGNNIEPNFAPDGTAPVGQTITGTAAFETLNGTAGNDTIDGQGGDDFINGSYGDDILLGGDGHDFIADERGSNTVDGGDGDDFIQISGGVANIDGGLGNDIISNSGEASIIVGGDGDDSISAFGSTLTYASGYPNYTYTYAGDTVDAGAGNDTVNAGSGATVTLGTGADTIGISSGSNDPIVVTDFSVVEDKVDLSDLFGQISNGAFLTLGDWDQDSNPFGAYLQIVQNGADTEIQRIFEIETFDPVTGDPVYTTEFRTVAVLQNVDSSLLTDANFTPNFPPDGSPAIGQTITGTNLLDDITGTAGDDIIDGLDGDDNIDGSYGDDNIQGGAGNDFISDSFGSNTVDGGEGDDFIFVSGGVATVDGGLGNDEIHNFGEASVIRGGDGDDIIGAFGSSLTYSSGYPNYTYTYAGDSVDAGAGNDEVRAGAGAIVTLGAGLDTIRISTGSSNDPVIVTDFSPTDDRVDLEVLLNLYTNGFFFGPQSDWDQVSNPFGTYLQLAQNGPDTEVQALFETEFEDPVTFDFFYTYEFRTVGILQNVDASLLTDANFTPALTPVVASNLNVIDGTPGNDSLVGTAGDDLIQGFEGDDSLQGLEGNDVLAGGPGQNIYDPGSGDDNIQGGAQVSFNDFDTLDYRNATAPINLNVDQFGNGTVTGDASVGTDTFDNIDRVLGTSGADTFVIGSGWSGKFGDDFFEVRGGGGDDTITGNGTLRVSFLGASEGVTVDLGLGTGSSTSGNDAGVGTDTFTGAFAVRGSDHDDHLIGSDGSQSSRGYESFRGQAGNDLIEGGDGIDQVDYVNDPGRVVVDLSGGIIGSGTGLDAYGGTDTLTGIENIRGSRTGDDDLIGDDGANEIRGEGGDDLIVGNGGDDLLIGGAGNDDIQGGDGTDTAGYNQSIAAGYRLTFDGTAVHVFDEFVAADPLGDDTLTGIEFVSFASGAELFRLQTGTAAGETITGDAAFWNIIFGGEGADQLNAADTAINILVGDGGGDTLTGGAGFNDLWGLEGDDVIVGGAQDQAQYLGSWYSFSFAFDNTTLTVTDNFSTVAPSFPAELNGFDEGSDTLTGIEVIGFDWGQDLYGLFTGGAGDDILNGTSDADLLFGGTGADQLFGGTGQNRYYGGSGDDYIEGGSRAILTADYDRVIYSDASGPINVSIDSLGFTTVVGDLSVGTDTLFLVDSVIGTDFADTYTAAGGFTSKFGGDNSEFEGGGGDDIITGNGNTRIAYTQASEAVRVDLELGTASTVSGLVANVGSDSFIGINAARGSAFADELLGSSGNDRLRGQGGNDFIDGRGGIDRVEYLNDGADVIVDLRAGAIGEGTAQDGYGTTDTLVGIENILGAVAGNDQLFGDAGNNEIRGEGGNDLIDGGAGDDRLLGGFGDDEQTGGAGFDQFEYFGGDGNDTITDFTVGEDVVRLRGGTGVTDFSDLVVSDDGNGNAHVTLLDGSTITLLGHAPGAVDASYFQIDNQVSTDIIGTDNPEVITGTESGEFIDGFAGNDTIDALGGDDFIVGGFDDDIITGGSGSDVFYFMFGDGNDTITDFVTGEDFLQFDGSTGIFEFADLIIANDINGDAVVDYGSGTITLQGIDSSLLTIGDIIVEGNNDPVANPDNVPDATFIRYFFERTGSGANGTEYTLYQFDGVNAPTAVSGDTFTALGDAQNVIEE